MDSPVGKKCRECAANRTHLQESGARQVLPAFAAALVTALAGGVLLHSLPFVLILAFPYGALIGELALRAGQRRRSRAMQVATGLAAALGALGSAAVRLVPAMEPEGAGGVIFTPHGILNPFALVVTGIAVAVAVSRVRYL